MAASAALTYSWLWASQPDHLEVRGVGGPHLVRTGSLSVVLLASFELHLRRLDQTFFTQDAVDGGLRYAEAPVAVIHAAS